MSKLKAIISFLLISLSISAADSRFEVSNTTVHSLNKKMHQIELFVNYPILGLSSVCGIEIRVERDIKMLISMIEIVPVYNLQPRLEYINDKTVRIEFEGSSAYVDAVILKSKSSSNLFQLLMQSQGRYANAIVVAAPCLL